MATTSVAVDAEANRVAYSNCLTEFTVTHLDQGTKQGVFKKAAKEACGSERAAMIDAMKKDELEFGSSEAEASAYAEEEADGVLMSFSDGYADYLNSNTRPVKQQ